MAYSMMSERENINGFWYYYLRCSGKWNVFIHWPPDMIKLAENIDTLDKAKEIAHKFTNINKEYNK